MSARPTHLSRSADGGLEITWSDGAVRHYQVAQLRAACPCATCREKNSQPAPASLLPILTPSEARPLTLDGMKPVGQYAYSIAFSDGHDTGIFSFELLRELGTLVEARM